MGVCKGKAWTALYCTTALLLGTALALGPVAAQQGMGVNPGSDTSMGTSANGSTGSGVGAGTGSYDATGTGSGSTGINNSNSGSTDDNGSAWNPRSRADTASPSAPELNRPSGAPSNTAPDTANQPRGTGNVDIDGRHVDDMADGRDRNRTGSDYSANAGSGQSYRGSGHHLYQASRYWLPDPGIEQGIGPARFRSDEHWRVAGYRETMAMNSVSGGSGSNLTVATSADEDFIREAHASSATEVRLGYIALQRAGDDEVKNFARRMVSDHGRAVRELERIARSSNIDLEKGMDHKELLLSERLRHLSGREFDREYMTQMIKHHEEDIAKFRNASVGDSVTAVWAERKLPKLEHHHDAAVAIGTEPV